MSRAEKQLRRKHRKERKLWRNSWSNRTISNLDTDVPPGVIFHKYEITEEPISLPEERNPEFDAAMENRRDELHDWTMNNPQRAIPELEKLLQQFPDSRLLMNWLAASYVQTNQVEKAEKVIYSCWEKHPDYLFARTALAEIHLSNGDLVQADAVMEHKWDLKLMYPHRDIFHISEYASMAHVAIRYYLLTEHYDGAEAIYRAMTELAPNHPSTHDAERMMSGIGLMRIFGKLPGNSAAHQGAFSQ